MTTHIIFTATNFLSELVEVWRTLPHAKFRLSLGEYVLNENATSHLFIPGIDKKNFSRLFWYLKTKEEPWTQIIDWKQEIEFFWTNPLSFHDLKHESLNNAEKINFVRAISRKHGSVDLDFYMNYNSRLIKDFYCPERPYSIQVLVENEKQIDSYFGTFMLLHNPDYISIKRIYTYIDKYYKYIFTISLTGVSTKHEVIENGILNYSVAIQINRTEISCSPKANIQLAGAFLERTLDLLGKKREYSLIPITPQFNFIHTLKEKYKENVDEEDMLQIQEQKALLQKKIQHVDYFFCIP